MKNQLPAVSPAPMGLTSSSMMLALLLLTAGIANADEAKVCFDAAVKSQWIKALPACTNAAKKGDATAQHNLGVMYDDGKGVAQDYKQAVRWYTLAAKQGYPLSQLNLGLMYEDGKGVALDHKQAVSWYKQAAAQGLAEARTSLGVMYNNGLGVAQDHKQAVLWYSLAATQGLPEAQHNLAWMHVLGLGIEQDYVRAHMWFNIAAAAGDADSVKTRNIIAASMTREQISRAQEMAKICTVKNYKNCE